MNLLDKTKRNTLLLITIVLSISWIVGYLFLEYQFRVSVEEQYQDRYNSVEKLFQININHEKQKMELELKKLVLTDGISKAVANKDYKQLHSIMSVYFPKLKKAHNDIEILTFRSPNGITLYRAHKPEFYGDKLSEQRKLILDTDRLKKSLSGFEVGKLDMTYRITQPVFHEDKYVGNIEIGLDPMHFMDNLNSVFKMQVGVAIDKTLLSIMLDTDTIPVKDNYLLLKSSEKFKQFFLENKSLNIDSFDSNNVIKVKMDIPLKNHLSEVLGYLVVGFDSSGIIEQKKVFVYRLLFLMLFMSLMIGFVLHKGFQRVLGFFTQQIFTDQLTGLKNRSALNSKLASKKTCILILSDIRDFSIINELYGVKIGNEVLAKFAKSFCKFADKYKFEAYRISSDEFVMLKEGNGDCIEEIKYNKILDDLHKTVHALDINIDSINEIIKIDIHSGITFDHVYSLEEAQMALKRSKEKSLPYLVYSKNVDTKERAEEIIYTNRLIRHSLESYNVIPFFQPIVDVNGKHIKYEALVRIKEIQNNKTKILFPDSFLEISKKSGLYIDIAQRVIRQSLLFFAPRDEKISINLYPSDLFNPLIVNTIVECIEKFDLPSRVVIEILEQENLGDFEKILEAIAKLRKIGVEIAIDDFGSGYSNYSHILKLKPDYLKIDASLIRNIVTDDESKILVKSIVTFAKDLNITTIAEYVENREIFELLKEYGVDEFQGYYFSKPIDLLNAS